MVPPRTKRRILAVLGVATVATLLSACSSGSTGSTDDGGKPSGTVHVLAEDINYTDNWKSLLPEFEKKTGITVKIDTVPYSNLSSKVLLGFSQKSSDYDVVFNDNVFGSGYHQSKYVDDLTPYLKYGKQFATTSDYYEPYLSPMQKSGATFGLPVYGESTMLMYRKDLFEQYGIDGPPKTMDELEAAAETIQEKSGGKVAGITLRGATGIQSVYPWSGFLRAFGGSYYTKGGKLDVDSADAVKATTFWTDLLKNYGPSGVGNFDWEQNRIAFTQGKAAMTIDATANGPYNEDASASTIAGKVGYAAIPYDISNPPTSGNTNNSLNVHGLYLNTNSKNKNAAAEFMLWATSPDVQANAVKTGDAVGVTATSVLEGKEYADKYGAFQDTVAAQVKTGNVDYLPGGQDSNTIITAVGQALSQALAGEKSPKAALQQAQQTLDQQLGK
ncbi:ABC transporter substrate-binding protein [Curtobacterium sp. VKM Ac-1376]|uniref:ABC transporter substrate-binding protein n=1 Tax=Curtobacterium sp. VKM Ac-1376 TaxID=123312 RepID=UPI00188D6893|nr:sugar ABC transporter substrate-binding protein [Curtobacterium sp. VKM Ac-1376]MBF4616226.1 extracellular solute-binding protein [Curtobacterium sp. VKM Ac-1376]